jgi:hypothetical protein
MKRGVGDAEPGDPAGAANLGARVRFQQPACEQQRADANDRGPALLGKHVQPAQVAHQHRADGEEHRRDQHQQQGRRALQHRGIEAEHQHAGEAERDRRAVRQWNFRPAATRPAAPPSARSSA